MKKIMILGASSLQLPAILKAKEMGLTSIVVDMNKDAVGFRYADIKLELSTIDIPNVVKAALEYKVDAVITLATDMPVRTVAAVGEALKIPAISVDSAKKATNKILMRDALAKCNVPIPHYYQASSEKEFITAVQQIRNMGYKCIIKPADSSGSRGVNLLSAYDEDSLKTAYAYSKKNSRSGEVIIEEFMEGIEVCVETLNVRGVCYPIQITDKLTTGSPYFVEMGHSQPSRLSQKTQDKIKEIAIAANMAIENYNGSSCTEIMVTKDGPKVVELGARLSGDYMTTDLVPLSTGIDMVKSIIQIALGEIPDYSPKFNKGSAIRFLSALEGKIVSISGEDLAQEIKGILRIGFDKKIGDNSVIIKNSLDRLGYVIAQAKTSDLAIKACEEAKNLINIATE